MSSAASDARSLIETRGVAALGSLDRQTGCPYVSLITVARHHDGAPLTLLSSLAMHTRNVAADPRVSLLYSANHPDADPLAQARVTVFGTLAPTVDATARTMFLARHPSAAMYADFADFAFFALTVERAHFIGGFGRIVELSRSDLLS